MTHMKPHFTGLAAAALLVIGSTLPGRTEDAAEPPASAPATTQAPPPSVPRPSLAPNTVEPAPAAAAAEPAPSRHRRYVHRYRRYGYYHTAYWQPFPIYWPHLYRNRIHWSRIPWAFNF
jgi:hypothetical protein